MTIGQMRLWLRVGDRRERHRRAAFIGDVATAVGGMMSEGDELQRVIDRLQAD
jgi:hypothetical protein